MAMHQRCFGRPVAVGIVAAILWLAVLASSASAQLLNEISYDPNGPDAGQEWVEIVNRTVIPLDLTGWVLTDRSATAAATLPALIVPPNHYVVVHFGTGVNDLDFSDG